MYFRAVRQFRDWRRYSPQVTINNPQQVNIGEQVNVASEGGQQVNVAKKSDRPTSYWISYICAQPFPLPGQNFLHPLFDEKSKDYRDIITTRKPM